MTEGMVNPVSGELFDADDLDALTRVEAEINRHISIVKRDMDPVYRAREIIRERAAALRGVRHVTDVPPRWRSQTQQRVLLCPSCGKNTEAQGG